MEDHKLFSRLIILILLHFLPSSLAASPYDCPFAFCGSNPYFVRFPFRMINQQPAICGYPGFDVTCNKQGTMVLNLPHTGDFSVRNIDYRSQVVQVYDPSVCTASKLSSLDLSGSPFSATPIQNYTLLSCPVEFTMSRYQTVGCLGNSTHSILATFSESFIEKVTKRNICRINGSLWSPISRYQDPHALTFDLNMDIFLTWDNPNCQDCVVDGGTCGYTNSTMEEIACFENNEKGNKGTTIALLIVSIALALPAIAASIAMALYICKDYRRVATWIPTRNVIAVTPETAIIPPSTLVIGLDQLTIESYTKVVLGESKRLPGHEDAVCAICLSEYDVKEIVRCIPECRHCFHADCIDEWLKMKGTCPVCRNSPSPAHVINL